MLYPQCKNKFLSFAIFIIFMYALLKKKRVSMSASTVHSHPGQPKPNPINYAWNSPEMYCYLAPVISLLIQKVSMDKLLPRLQRAVAASDYPAVDLNSRRILLISKWHLRSAIVQGLVGFLALKTLPLVGSLFLLSAGLQAGYALINSKRGGVNVYEFNENGTMKSMSSGTIHLLLLFY